MIRAALIALTLAAITVDTADARRRRHIVIKIVKRPAAAAMVAPASAPRIIPMTRWRLWCERIGC